MPQVSHFLNVITTRQTSQDGDLIADFTLKALKSLRTSHDRLKALEDAVWSGRSADATTLRDLESLGEIDGQCVNGDVTQKLFVRFLVVLLQTDRRRTGVSCLNPS